MKARSASVQFALVTMLHLWLLAVRYATKLKAVLLCCLSPVDVLQWSRGLYGVRNYLQQLGSISFLAVWQCQNHTKALYVLTLLKNFNITLLNGIGRLKLANYFICWLSTGNTFQSLRSTLKEECYHSTWDFLFSLMKKQWKKNAVAFYYEAQGGAPATWESCLRQVDLPRPSDTWKQSWPYTHNSDNTHQHTHTDMWSQAKK